MVMFVLEADDRAKERHYRAWELINSARGFPGDGGRRDTLRDLNEDGVDLPAAPLAKACLEEVELQGAHLLGASLSRSFLHRARLSGAFLLKANLSGAFL
jgi:hypothetical protein